MKFGQVADPSQIDFSIPSTPQATYDLLEAHKSNQPMNVYVGCPTWSKANLKGFFPRGTKDELSYYATQFNAIELNATYYKSPSKQQVETWKEKTSDGFKFFPKIPQSISHYSRLLNTTENVEDFVDATVLFEDKLGIAFIQMIENYKPKDFDRISNFLHQFPKGYPLAVEVRNEEWFTPEIAEHYYKLLIETNKTNVLVDTAGRRDMMHMRLTTPVAFIRFVSANHPLDYSRLDEWVEVIKNWKEAGLQELYFFIHQNIEVESPLLAAHFIQKLNAELNTNLHVPQKSADKLKSITPTLF